MYAPPPPYAMLGNQGSQNIRPPPYRGNVPRYQSDYYRRRSKTGCCCRIICCCCCCLFFQFLILAAAALYFYAVYKPQLPSYNVAGLNLKAFGVQPDLSLNTELEVTMKAENPNNGIGFVYGRDSSVDVIYADSTICSGKLPNFHQGHKNITMMVINLKGKVKASSGLQQALQENQNSGKFPLLVKVKAPVLIVVGKFYAKQITVYVNCSLVVGSLEPNKNVEIISSNYKFAYTL